MEVEESKNKQEEIEESKIEETELKESQDQEEPHQEIQDSEAVKQQPKVFLKSQNKQTKGLNKQQIENEFPDSITIPIFYGTISFYLGKKSTEDYTHKWMFFMRGLHNQDLSNVVDRVHVSLHESFPDNQKYLNQPPYEFFEKGWGGFDFLIRIHFKAPYNKEPLELLHKLQLFHQNTSQPQSSKKPVMSENYEEVVFVNPSVDFYKAAKNCTTIPDAQITCKTQGGKTQHEEQKEAKEKMEFFSHFTVFNTEDHRQKLDDALKVVKMEVERLQQCMLDEDKKIEQLQSKINDFHLKGIIEQQHKQQQQHQQQIRHQQQQSMSQQQMNHQQNQRGQMPYPQQPGQPVHPRIQQDPHYHQQNQSQQPQQQSQQQQPGSMINGQNQGLPIQQTSQQGQQMGQMNYQQQIPPQQNQNYQ